MIGANINNAKAIGLAGDHPKRADARSAGASGPQSSGAVASCVLDVYDMDCAACAILIESELQKLPGVASASVHYATQRARISYDQNTTSEAAIAERIMTLGHTVHSNSQSLDRASIVRRIRRGFQWQTGLAAFCAMQIMMFSLPRLLGGDEVDAALAKLMDGAALALALPVVFFCAGSFLRGAIREWKIRRIGMDTAIAVSIVSAFAGSLWHVWIGSGQLYFDSIAMFVSLLLGVRWFEWERRESNRASLERLALKLDTSSYALFDEINNRIDRFIDVCAIEPGSLILIGHLQSVPTDGWIESDGATLDESVLTGESLPVSRPRSALISAGCVNLAAPFLYRSQGTAQTSTTQRLLDLADRSERPEHRSEFDFVSRWFVPALFAVAAITLVAFLDRGIDVSLERAIAVLIVSCPCALALAAPSAYARAFTQLAVVGTIVRRAEALDRLASVDTFVFDKTGTLTDPMEFKVTHLRGDTSESKAKGVIVSLETYANHPLAVSIRKAFGNAPLLVVDNASWKTGLGVEGEIGQVGYRLGRWEFVREHNVHLALNAASPTNAALYLVDADGLVCVVEFAETLRTGAAELVAALTPDYHVEILSGDRQDRVDQVSGLLGVESARGGVSAQGKQERIAELQSQGQGVAMVGDGWNDSVAFAIADVSIAASGANDAALRGADLVCASHSLLNVATTLHYAKRLRRIVRENYAWAIGYNIVAIPVAALGYIDPILAALGMATSSALVVLNTMRLHCK